MKKFLKVLFLLAAVVTIVSLSDFTSYAARNGWDESHNRYYVEDNYVTGIQRVDGKLYVFNTDGSLYKRVGLVAFGGAYYFMDRDYSLKTGPVRVYGSKAYYFSKADGRLVVGRGIKRIDGEYYYLNNDNSLYSGWFRIGKNRYFISPYTFTIARGWTYIGTNKFYFMPNGILVQDLRRYTNKLRLNYYICVNRAQSCVTVYAPDTRPGFSIPIVSFVCSAGYATPLGWHRTGAKHRWWELMGPCWGQYCTNITPNVLFHSVFYNSPYDNRSLSVSAYNKLGTIASHGCVRLTCGDAKWIYDYCPSGTRVLIYDSSTPGPFDKPSAPKLAASHTWDPTDPAFAGRR